MNGLRILIKSENNARFHLLATLLVLGMGFVLKIESNEWIFILLGISLVWMAEALNTAIEKMCNFVSPQFHELIGEIKDLAAGGVLVVSIVTLIIGIIVFLPKILTILHL
jgi:diacylglycerol kinase